MAEDFPVKSAPEAQGYDLGPDDLAADLGLPNVEGRVLRATLVTRIRAAIVDRHLTQAEAGEIMGLPQSKVSELVSGAASGFSVERLFGLLNKLGVSTSIAFYQEPDFAPGETGFIWDRESDTEIAPDEEETEESTPAFAKG